MSNPALDKPMNVLLYTRVSSDEQVTNFSLDTQQKICKGYAEKQKLNIIKIFEEQGYSGKNTDRPELIKLLDYCKKHQKDISGILVYKFDRFARNTLDYLAVKQKLSEYGIKIISASEATDATPYGKFMETLMAAVSQLDNEVRGERARNGMRTRFNEGYQNGRVPLGYKSTKLEGKSVLIADSKTYGLVKKAWHLMATGTHSLSQIAEVMNKWGLKIYWNKKFKLIRKQSAYKIFTNKFYCGYVVSKIYGEAKGKHAPMITENLFYTVQSIITGRNQKPFETKRLVVNPDFPLKGILKCGICSKALVGANCKGRHKYYPKYWCSKHPSPSLTVENAEANLNTLLSNIQPSKEIVELFTLILKRTYDKKLHDLRQAKATVEGELAELKNMLSLLVEGHLKGTYPDEIFFEQKAKIEGEILAKKIVSNDNLCDQYDIETLTSFAKALLSDLKKAYEASELGQKRILLGSIFPDGLVYNKGMLLNRSLSPLFSFILKVSKNDSVPSVSFCEHKDTWIEPILTSLSKLILAYPDYKTQFSFSG